MRHIFVLFALTSTGLMMAQMPNISASGDLFPNELDGWSKSHHCQVEFTGGVISILASSGSASLSSEKNYTDFILNGQCYLEDSTRGALIFRQRETPQLSDMTQGYKVSLNHFEDQQNPTGSIIDVARGTWLPRFDTAGWFDIEVSALGNHLQIKLNDQVVAQTFDHNNLDGHLAFEVPKGRALKLRNMQIAIVSDIDVGLDIRSHFDQQLEIPFEQIFNGQTTEGWSATGDGTWNVEDGVLHGFSGAKGGFLISDAAYQDFHLILDFKIKKGDNSGIFIRRLPEANDVTLQNSIECNIYDHNGFSHAYSTGSLATHARAWSNLISYEGWNTAEIFAWGDQVAMYINGIKASHAKLPQFNQRGNICLQGGIKIFSEDKGPSDIYFRNIRIRSVD